MSYRVTNFIDNDGRMIQQPLYELGRVPGQYASHGMSYLEARTQMQGMGDVMGLDKIVVKPLSYWERPENDWNHHDL